MADNLSYKLINDRNYITKSKINKKTLRDMGFPKSISVKDVKNAFDLCAYKKGVVGNPFNEYQQKHVKFVHKSELYRKAVKGF